MHRYSGDIIFLVETIGIVSWNSDRAVITQTPEPQASSIRRAPGTLRLIGEVGAPIWTNLAIVVLLVFESVLLYLSAALEGLSVL